MENGGLKRHQIAWIWSYVHVPTFEAARNLTMPGTLLVLGTTVVVIFVFLNMIYQYKAMDGQTAFWLAVKIGLIGIFATNWVQFNALSSAILAGIDSIAGALVASVGGGVPGLEIPRRCQQSQCPDALGAPYCQRQGQVAAHAIAQHGRWAAAIIFEPALAPTTRMSVLPDTAPTTWQGRDECGV